MSGDAILSVENLTLAYGRTVAVEDVGFRVRAGEFLYVVGSNGSGKSTLFKGILGLMKPVAGKAVNRAGPNATAFLPQEQESVCDFPATVRETVLAGCQKTDRLLPFYTRSDRIVADRAMEAMGIRDLAGHRLGELSGGQRRRALLARSLCREPRLLLLDEPYNGLDPETADGLAALLERLRAARGMTILVTSHDLEAAGRAGRVLEMRRRLIFDGTSEQWLSWRKRACRASARLDSA